MVRTQIQMTEDQVKKFKKIASKKHWSMAEIIRQAVNNFMATKADVDFEERKKRAIAASGRFHSKVSNLSEAHDKYLTEAFVLDIHFAEQCFYCIP